MSNLGRCPALSHVAPLAWGEGLWGEGLGLGRASGLAPGKRQQASAVQGYGSRN
jgi:hypothetical protein